MNLWNFNLWLYHSVEVLLCDIKIFILEIRIAFVQGQIKYLESRE